MMDDSNDTKNILLIVVDALRPDRVGAYNQRSLTPNIDQLAASGEVFDQCYAAINATDPSMTTILSGWYPTRHGILNHGKNITTEERKNAAGLALLPSLLTDHVTYGIDMMDRWHSQGYDEYVNPIKSNRSRIVNTAADIVSFTPEHVRGFLDQIYHRFRSTQDGPTSFGIDAAPATDIAIDQIDNADGPWFMLLHYWETHCPYISVEDCPGVDDHLDTNTYATTSLEQLLANHDHPDGHWIGWLRNNLRDCTTVGDVVQRYDAGTWWVDKQIGRLLQHLDRAGITDETAVIVTADHGESLTEHGILFDHHGLYDPTIKVPFIIDAPGFAGREDRFVQHFDIAPTILDLLGYEYGPGRFDGTSLVPRETRTRGRSSAFIEEAHTNRKRAIRTEQFKYIKRLPSGGDCRYCGYKHAPNAELYDLATDPNETQNIADDRPAVVRRLQRQLTDWVAERPEPITGSKTFDDDDVVINQLENMGYI